MRRFERLAERFAERLAAIEALEDPAGVRQDWAQRNRELHDFLLPRPPVGFLAHSAIRFQMFVDDRYLAHELPYVLARAVSPALLVEDPIGLPATVVLPSGELTSSNTVHHLHHLLRYEEATGRRIAAAGTVVEWGAGYGNLAKLLVRLHGGSPTLVLVDTPVFSAVQWLYLSSVFGEDSVVLHTAPGTSPTAGRINIVPAGLASALDVRADLFVSTWALNESAATAQELVLDREFFGAGALLLAMNRGDPLESRVVAAGARPVALGCFMPGQYYFVR